MSVGIPIEKARHTLENYDSLQFGNSVEKKTIGRIVHKNTILKKASYCMNYLLK